MFISGFATDVWVQRETETLKVSGEMVLANHSLTYYSIQAVSKNRLIRNRANWRMDTFKSLQSVVQLKLRFELRLTSPILELIRSLLSLYNFGQQQQPLPIEARTWMPEITDLAHTVKIWIKDQNTGEGYLHEGCGVSEMEVISQSRSVTVISFGIICLKTTYLSSMANAPTLREDAQTRPISEPKYCGAYFTSTDFTDDLTPFLIPGVTSSGLIVQRTLTPCMFAAGQATRFSKTPPMFSGSLDTRINSDLRSFLSQTERYGAAILRFGQDTQYWLEALLPSVALTYGEAQLHSTQDTPTLTINVNTIEDFSASGGAALRLYRAPEGWDGGEIGETDTYATEGIDGGNVVDNLIQPQPPIDGGTF